MLLSNEHIRPTKPNFMNFLTRIDWCLIYQTWVICWHYKTDQITVCLDDCAILHVTGWWYCIIQLLYGLTFVMIEFICTQTQTEKTDRLIFQRLLSIGIYDIPKELILVNFNDHVDRKLHLALSPTWERIVHIDCGIQVMNNKSGYIHFLYILFW